MSRTCAACDNPASDGIVICRRCERQASQRLGEMESDRAELEVTLSRQARLSGATDGPRSANRPLVYNDQASDVLGAQRAILASWCRLVHEEISGTWPRRDTVRAMSLFIENHMPELRKHEAAGELVTEIRDLSARVHRCIDYPEDRARIHVGHCPEQPDGQQCPGEIWLHLPYRNDGKRPRVRCKVCDTVWWPEQFHRLGHRVINPDGAARLMRAIA